MYLGEVELAQALAHGHVLAGLEPHHVEGNLVHTLLDEPEGLQLLVISAEGSGEEWDWWFTGAGSRWSIEQ